MRKMLMVTAMAIVLAVPAGAAAQQSQFMRQESNLWSQNPDSEVCEPAGRYLNKTKGWPATLLMCHPARGS